MSLNIGTSLTGGLRRVATRNGVVLTLAYVLLGVVWQVLFYSAFVTWLHSSGEPATAVGLPTVDLPLAVSAVGAVVSLLLLQVAAIVAIRTFVGGQTGSIPAEYYTRNIAAVLVNAVVGSFVYGLLVLAGSVLLVVPGVIAYVAFLFMLFYVAVEDENFVAALRESWTLTRGHWLALFALVLILFVGLSVVSGVLSVVASLVVGAVAGPALGTLVSGVVTFPFSLLVLGILAEAFVQLRGDDTVTAI